MSVKKLVAILCIFLGCSLAWLILGGVNSARTSSSFHTLKSYVSNTYGSNLQITAPSIYVERAAHFESKHTSRTYSPTPVIEKDRQGPSESDVSIHVSLDPRKKGNLWFPTFKSSFIGTYVFNAHELPKDLPLFLEASFESKSSVYNDISYSINGVPQTSITPLVKGDGIPLTRSDNSKIELTISYSTNGMDSIRYIVANKNQLTEFKKFHFVITTDFNGFDFPSDVLSPTEKIQEKNHAILTWNLENAVTGKDVGITIPSKLNPGDIVDRASYFAPVSLLFFFIVAVLASIIIGIRLHPMHYFFLACTFFSFHLMFSYFSDQMDIHLSFIVSSVVSLFLTISYLLRFTPRLFSLFIGGIQFIYLIVFTYSFFFKGITGLIVTLAAVITLFLLMQFTAKANWDELFKTDTSQ